MKITNNNIMSLILYYSNYCSFCSSILPTISQSQIKKEIHFICIDNRVKKGDGTTYVILPNQKEMVLPSQISKVPALMLLNRGNQIIYGNEIINYLKPIENNYNKKVQETVEPDAFYFGDINSSGVTSDNYSFLDQSIESLSAKGDGGLRQIKNYATLEYLDNIETPPDDYTPNKIGSVNMEKIQTEREKVLGN
jgi:hypothetical protein